MLNLTKRVIWVNIVTEECSEKESKKSIEPNEEREVDVRKKQEEDEKKSRRSARTIKLPNRYNEFEINMMEALLVGNLSSDVP